MRYEALSKFVEDRRQFSEHSDRTTMQSNWARWQKMYRNYIDPKHPSAAKIHIPQTFATTFRLFSAVMSNIRRNKELVRYVAEPKHDGVNAQAMLASEAMQQATNYYMAKAGVNYHVRWWELEALTHGTSFMKTTWKFEEQVLPDKTYQGGAIVQPEVLYDGIKCEHRPLSQIYVDPKVINLGGTVAEMEYIIDERYLSKHDVLGNNKFYNKDEIKRLGKPMDRAPEAVTDELFEQSQDDVSGTGLSGINTRDRQSDLVLVREYWGRVPSALLNSPNLKNYDHTHLKDWVNAHVISVDGICAYHDINGYPDGRKPYDVIRCYPIPNYFYGIGIPELIKDLQRATNAVTNQRIDNVMLVLNRIWLYRENMVNARHLVSKPGAKIPIRGLPHETIMPLDTPDVTMSAYREQEIYDNYIQKVSGVADIFFGQSTKQTRISATEATFMTEMGAGMMEEIVAGQVQDGFIPMMEKVRDYVQTYMEGELAVTLGGEVQTVSAEDLKGEFQLIPTIGEQMFTKTAEMQKAMMLLETTVGLKPVLQEEGYEVQTNKILERIYDYAGWKDFATIVKRAEEEGQAQGQPQQEGLGGANVPGGVPGVQSFAGYG